MFSDHGLAANRWKASEDHQSLVGTGVSAMRGVTFGLTAWPPLLDGPCRPARPDVAVASLAHLDGGGRGDTTADGGHQASRGHRGRRQ